MLRRTLLAASGSDQVRGLLTGTSATRAMVARYVAGETADDAVRAASELRAAGLLVTLDYLGEDTTDAGRAAAVADEYLALLGKLSAAGLTGGGGVEVSVKLTAVGLLLGDGDAPGGGAVKGGAPNRAASNGAASNGAAPNGAAPNGGAASGGAASGGATVSAGTVSAANGAAPHGSAANGAASGGGLGEKIAAGHAGRIAAAAAAAGTTVTIDAEDHRTTDATLRIAGALRARYPETGSVVQASLRRTETDVRALATPGTRVRLCKGAYNEPVSVAYADRHEIDKSYARCLRILMEGPGYPMIATHDPRLVRIATALGLYRDPASFEYQMLYGIRADEQARLATAGAQVRVYVPYGRDWYGYLVRRLAERPASVGLLARSLVPSIPGRKSR